MSKFKKIICLLCSLFIFFINTFSYASVSPDIISNKINKTAEYIKNTTPTPNVGSIGGEWAILGLARSNYYIPKNFYEKYYSEVEKYVVKLNGNLHKYKYTEYSRLIIALTSIGKNPTNVGGYNLLRPLADFDKTIWQGINGAIFALIALDSNNYDIPVLNDKTKIQATRELYINHILSLQLKDGGWAISGEKSDPDITAMAIQALSKYKDNKNVKIAIEKSLNTLSNLQNKNGGYESWGVENAESCAQVIVALCELGIALDDFRFIKNGNSLLDNLLSYSNSDGSFNHIYNSGANQMATEQCFYALVSANRAIKKQNTLYSMSDNISLKNKNMYENNLAKNNYFTDIDSSNFKTAINNLSKKGIISGKSSSLYNPKGNVTRAEFATIITKLLNISSNEQNNFKDVQKTDWYYKYINSASHYKIISGISNDKFNPKGYITFQEVSVIIKNIALYLNKYENLSEQEINSILSKHKNATSLSNWSKESFAFCIKNSIFDHSLNIESAKQNINREELAHIINNTLNKFDILK